MDGLRASVVITTKNRKDDLRRAIASCLRQSARPEVLVIDDGSTDGTSDMVRREFPSVQLHREDVSRGYIVQRNRGAVLASGDIIFSIDDDAEFISDNTVAQTLEEFVDPTIAAVAIPFVNVNYSDAVLQRASKRDVVVVTSAFIGTAYALRREIFQQFGGFREFLFHQGEEEDLCIRMLDGGFFTRLGNADPIYHYELPKRDRRRMDVYGARNKVLFCWYNIPSLYLLPNMLIVTLNRLRFGLRMGHPIRAAHGLLKGFAGCVHQISQRRPISKETFRLFRQLRRRREIPLENVQYLGGEHGAKRLEVGSFAGF